ncbi:hypothetical protein ACFLZW_03325 [Chloroflexota bacterium]
MKRDGLILRKTLPLEKIDIAIPVLYNPGMAGIEWRAIEPEKMIQDIENIVSQHRENKYAFQVGLKDLDFDINEDLLKALGLPCPFTSINQAEQALLSGAISPTKFIEHDETQHQVLAFDHRPVGYSGFMDCVTHSLALTNHGLFEVGHYPAMNMASANRFWQWFLHRRLVTADEVTRWQVEKSLNSVQVLDQVYQALVNA